jgi:hypothetical protein
MNKFPGKMRGGTGPRHSRQKYTRRVINICTNREYQLREAAQLEGITPKKLAEMMKRERQTCYQYIP